MPSTAAGLAEFIRARLEAERAALSAQFATPGTVRSCVLDGLLPENLARELFAAFPERTEMRRRHGLRESKYVSAQLDRHAPLIEEAVFAFQDPRVVVLLGEITGLAPLIPDPRLYAGGISLMSRGCFLNPHLDNSHDAEQALYRSLNSLYYLTPGWRLENGGNLELWDLGPRGAPRTLESCFNRLVLMETTRDSWHSVSPIVAGEKRTCVSNYFFRKESPTGRDYFHATSFRGRPGQRARDLLLRADNLARTAILSVVPVPTWHIYRKSASPATRPGKRTPG